MTLDMRLLTFPPVTRSAPGRVNAKETEFEEILTISPKRTSGP